MRIAQVSPLHESVPPKLYGGTERVVHFLTEALVDLGHDVTLFASGDSKTRAELVACAPGGAAPGPALRRSEGAPRAHARGGVRARERLRRHPLPHRLRPLRAGAAARGAARDHDARPHGHSRSGAAARTRSPTCRWCRSRTRSASRCPTRTGARPCITACRPSCIRSGRGAGGYLAFLGRVSPEKRLDRAIEIAMRLGMPLKIAAKVDKKDQDYFETQIKPMMTDPRIEFVGEIGEAQKNEFLGDAAALLFPDRLARAVRAGDDRGDGVRHAGDRVSLRVGARGDARRGLGVRRRHARRGGRGDRARRRAAARAACASYFEERFLARRMATDYVAVYKELAADARHRSGQGGRRSGWRRSMTPT